MHHIQSSLKRLWHNTAFQAAWQTVAFFMPFGFILIALRHHKKIGPFAESAWRLAGTKLSSLKRKSP